MFATPVSALSDPIHDGQTVVQEEAGAVVPQLPLPNHPRSKAGLRVF
jgi:hypothetical protein